MMPFTVDINDAKKQFPAFTFIKPLTPSAQKAAFHVRDEHGRDLCLKIISPQGVGTTFVISQLQKIIEDEKTDLEGQQEMFDVEPEEPESEQPPKKRRKAAAV